jgi:hypothetical protein
LSLNHVLTGQIEAGGEGAGTVRVDSPGGGNRENSTQLDYSSEGLATLMHHICIVFIMIAAYYAMVRLNILYDLNYVRCLETFLACLGHYELGY